MIRVLTEYHHHALYESLLMLFEDRFGWEVYRMSGMDWWDREIWNWERHMPHGEPVARQYLEPWGTDRDMGDWSERDEPAYPGRVHKLLTMAQAQAMGVDIVIATLAENEQGLHDFARSIDARFGLQLGNQGTVNRYHLADFSLISTTRDSDPWTPFVRYHQEFSLVDYRFEYPPTQNDYVGTWVQALPSDPAEYARFIALAQALPELRFRYHGHIGPHDQWWGGNVETSAEVGAQMRAARVGLHLKRWSDGFGHSVHGLFATGKPVVATASYYKDKLAGPLFVEGVTSWDVQTHTHQETIDFIRRLAEDDELHERMSRASAARFRELVDFDQEAEQIRAMMDGVLSDRRVPA